VTEIAGTVAVVTGGAAGIGRGIAEQLIEEGATVVIADIERPVLDATAAAIGATPVAVDVRDPVSVQALADAVTGRFGRVDIIVNNAGVGPQGRISDLTLSDWRWLLGVNLGGVINGIDAFLPHLRANTRGGHIVNTASMSAFSPLPGLGAYAASKAAVCALSEALAAELAEDGLAIGVTILAPGSVRTQIARSLRNRPAGLAGGLTDLDLAADPVKSRGAVWLSPADAGRITTRAIRNNDLYAITHPGLWGRVAARHQALRAAFDKYPPVGSAGTGPGGAALAHERGPS
jgi:NAD(P)-dependent dehydrogenase (short-subunit alcohol dehydrogenase family)